MKHTINLKDRFGAFLSDGDAGNEFRFCELEPRISRGEHVVLDFDGVTNMTDSFANACFGHLFRHLDFCLEGKLSLINGSPVVKSFLTSAWSLAQKQAAK
jgi:hypothetical protein